MKRLYTNAVVVSPGVCLPNTSVLEEDGVIAQVYPPSMALPSFDEAIDCDGHLLVPAFFDIHAHVSKPQDIGKTATAARKAGVMNLLVGVDDPDYDLAMQICRETAAYMAKGDAKGARVLGVHLAGPYADTDFLAVKALKQICAIRKVSFDMKLSGSFVFAQKLRQAGIVPCSGGHCEDGDVLVEALQAGLRDISGFEAATLEEVLTGLGEETFNLEFAGDKAVEKATLFRFMFKVKGLDRLLMTTSGQDVPFNEGLKALSAVSGLALKDLICTTALNQAISLGIHDIGRIEPGYKAEFALLDEQLNVVKTF